MDADVQSQDLPGLGRSYEIGCADGGRISVVVQHNGLRDLYSFEPGGDSPTSVLQLSDAQARALGAILAGAYFRPTAVEDVPATFGDLALDWLAIPHGARAIGRSLHELRLSNEPGVVLVALMREGKTELQPNGDTAVRGGDRLLIAGHSTAVAQARATVTA